MIRQHYDEVRRLEGFVKFISNEWRSFFRGESDVVLYPRSSLPMDKFPRFSANAFRGVYCGYMVTHISLQLAYFMGFTRVYLIGVDFNYSEMHNGLIAFRHESDHADDHFTPNYFQPGEIRSTPQLPLAERAMRCAKDFYESRNRKIWNATRGGKLEVFDRVSLEEALSSPR